MWFTILYNMVRLDFFRRDSNDSHFRSRMMAVIESGWSYLYGVLVTNLAAILAQILPSLLGSFGVGPKHYWHTPL